MTKTKNTYFKQSILSAFCFLSFALTGCAQVDVPNPRTVDIDAPTRANVRSKGINEGYEPVVYVQLGSDVLVPQAPSASKLPDVEIGPIEFRNESLALALQLVLDDYDIPLAFETQTAFSQTITVSKLKGPLQTVVRKLCGLANSYCAYDDGILTVKDLETFSVTMPPVDDTQVFDDIAAGLAAITGGTPVVDPSTRTIIYTATSRNAKRAEDYFEKLRSNTALIVFETYIWEVTLSGANTTGIRWDQIEDFGAFGGFSTGVSINGTPDLNVGAPISIGLPTGSGNVNLDTGDILQFLSSQGNVKTISQPQLTVLSGSEATLRVAETQNYIESLSRTTDVQGDETVSTTTGTVDSGFTLTIGSVWDQATVYGNVEIELDEFLGFQNFDAGDGNTLQLPRTSERDLTTQVRIRPGDSVLIAGLVTERDNFNTSGPGVSRPLFPTSRSASVENTELVVMLKPRVIAYVPEKDQAYMKEKLAKKQDYSLAVSTIEPTTNITSAPAPEAPSRSTRVPAPAPVAATPAIKPVTQTPLSAYREQVKASTPIEEPTKTTRYVAPTPAVEKITQPAAPAPVAAAPVTPTPSPIPSYVAVSSPPADMEYPVRNTSVTTSPAPKVATQPQIVTAPTASTAPVDTPIPAYPTYTNDTANSINTIPLDLLNPGRSTQ
ncbi:MAG: type II and III secretion system family protein [Micavibrio sp.]|nr:type II and III secretion system family protein [Micavibrio sp.]